MKRCKPLPLLLAVLLLLLLTACGGGGTSKQDAQPPVSDPPKQDVSSAAPTGPSAPSSGSQEPAATQPLDLDAVLRFLEGDPSGFTPHVLTAAEQAALRASVEAEGGTVSFAPDGSFTVKSPEGGSFTLSPDGSMTGVDDDGQSIGSDTLHSGVWPSGAFARAVPDPGFPIATQFEDESGLELMFDGVTLEQAKAYGAQLRSAGYTVEVDEFEEPTLGMYRFSGQNADGLCANFTWLMQNGQPMCVLSVAPYRAWDPNESGYDPNQTILDLPDTIAYGDSWPVSGLLAMLPAPNFGSDLRVDLYEDKAFGHVYGAAADDFNAYLSFVTARGFTLEPETEYSPENYNTMQYMAKNAQGYQCVLTYMDYSGGVLSIGVALPE